MPTFPKTTPPVSETRVQKNGPTAPVLRFCRQYQGRGNLIPAQGVQKIQRARRRENGPTAPVLRFCRQYQGRGNLIPAQGVQKIQRARRRENGPTAPVLRFCLQYRGRGNLIPAQGNRGGGTGTPPETKRKISQSMSKYWAGLPFKPVTDTGNTSGTTTGTGTVPGV